MKYLSFTFKNIRNFVIHHPVMFLFLIIVQIICCVAVFIVCGMANNMYYKENFDNLYNTTKSISFSLEDSEMNKYALSTEYNDEEIVDRFYVLCSDDGSEVIDERTGEPLRIYDIEHKGCMNIKDIRPKIDDLKAFFKDDLNNITLLMYPNKITNTNKVMFDQICSAIPGTEYVYDKMFTDSNEKIFMYDSESNNYKKYIADSNILTYNGIDYKYAGSFDGLAMVNIPYNALDDNFAVFAVHIILNRQPDQAQLNKINNKLNELFGNEIDELETPEPYDPLENGINQMVYVISLVMIAIILLAISKFYNYILSDRKQILTVLRSCGATRTKVHLIYMLEIIITMISTTVISFLIFRYILFDYIARLYPSFNYFYNTNIYITIIGAYILVAIIIMIFTVIPTTKATIIDMKRRK